jgi:hypothetical protein
MLVTAGFRDVLDMGHELRCDMFDLRLRFPNPLALRQLRVEVEERIRYDGAIETPLDPNAAQAAIANLVVGSNPDPEIDVLRLYNRYQEGGIEALVDASRDRGGKDS